MTVCQLSVNVGYWSSGTWWPQVLTITSHSDIVCIKWLTTVWECWHHKKGQWIFGVKAKKKENPVLRARPTHFFLFGRFFFFNLPKFCKICLFLTKILKFYLKNVENKSEYFLKKILQKKVRLLKRKFHVFKVLFAPEKEEEKKSPDRPTHLGRSVRP